VGHAHLRDFLDQRVRDGVIRRVLGKWMNARVWENGVIDHPEDGVPQGGCISPLLSNLYLHEVLDLWFEREVTPQMRGRVFMVRFAEDALLGFTHYWGRSRKGRWVVQRKTAKSRFTRTLRRFNEWCRRNRYLPLAEQRTMLNQKLRGHHAYFGIKGNAKALDRLRYEVQIRWRKWLSCRSGAGRLTWDQLKRLLQPARVVHSVYAT